MFFRFSSPIKKLRNVTTENFNFWIYGTSGGELIRLNRCPMEIATKKRCITTLFQNRKLILQSKLLIMRRAILFLLFIGACYNLSAQPKLESGSHFLNASVIDLPFIHNFIVWGSFLKKRENLLKNNSSPYAFDR